MMDNDNEFIHVDEEQQTPQPNNAQAQIVSPGRGYHWVERSLSEIFVPHFGKWFLAGLIYSLITTILPLLGIILAALVMILNPLFFAGGYLGAHKVQQKTGEVTPQQFFEGFTHPRKFALLAYCGIYILIILAISFAFFSAIDVEALAALNWEVMQSGQDQLAVQAEVKALAELIGPYFIWMFLSFVALSLAGWFAPNLILFQQQNPLAALLNSFIGGIKNILAMIILVLVMIGIAIIIGLILMLAGLIISALMPPMAAELLMNTLVGAILLPIIIGIGYISYREVYLGDVKKSQNSL
ncbi:MAG: BPSS1780 family membrane protein [Kangiella sp.]|nr:BPSS1780 family membrane protein [Kangiella sp.]